MSNGTLNGVCVRPEQGNGKDYPMLTSSSPTNAPETSITKGTVIENVSSDSNLDKKTISESSVSESDFRDVTNNVSKSPSNPNTANKGSGRKGKKDPKKPVPKYNQSGCCTRCKSVRSFHESIECNLCGDLFHALCPNKRGGLAEDSICTKTFLSSVRPAIAHYSAFEKRWGSFMFFCDKCSDTIKTLSHSYKSNTPKTSDALIPSSKRTVEMQDSATMTNPSSCTSDCNIQTDNPSEAVMPSDDKSNHTVENFVADSNIVATVSNVVTKNVESMLGNLKESLLTSVEELISEKMQLSGLAVSSPFPTCFRQRSPSTPSTIGSVYSDDYPGIINIDENSLTGSSSIEMTSCQGYESHASDKASILNSPSIENLSKTPHLSTSLQMSKSTPDTNGKSYQEALTSTKLEITSRRPSPSPRVNNGMAIHPPLVDNTEDSHIIVLRVEDSTVSMANAKDMSGEVLKKIPVNFLEAHPKSGKVVISFPSLKDKEKGKHALNESTDISAAKITISEAKKMFPKITVTNIPNSLISHITSMNETLSPVDLREKLKSFLEEKFLEKNEVVQDLVTKQKRTFKIVYVKSGKNYTTAGIKVSPDIRHFLMNQQCIYIGYNKCNVTDRFDVTQCFRCQKMGHKSDHCTETTAICKFCSASHVTRSCPHRNEQQRYRCINCSHSTNEAHKLSFNTHHSGSDLCPIIQQEKDKLRQRTEYTKNM